MAKSKEGREARDAMKRTMLNGLATMYGNITLSLSSHARLINVARKTNSSSETTPPLPESR